MIATIIPSRTDEYLDALLRSMDDSSPGWTQDRHVIVADNGLSSSLREKWPSVTFVPYQPPSFIFAEAMNLGVSRANHQHDLFLMNDDTRIVSGGALDMLEQALGRFGDFGLVSPTIRGGCGNEEQLIELPPLRFMQTENPTIVFIAVLIPRHVWEKVGPMDERFTGYGYDDNDYSRRVNIAGWRTGIVGGVRVFHRQHGTFGAVYGPVVHTEMFEANRRRYEEKWGAGV